MEYSAVVDKLAAWLKEQTEEYVAKCGWEDNTSRLYLQCLDYVKRQVRYTLFGSMPWEVKNWFLNNEGDLSRSEWREIALAAYDVEIKRLEGLFLGV